MTKSKTKSHIFHAVVWTERAAALPINEFNNSLPETFFNKINNPLWGNKVKQILLAPSKQIDVLPVGKIPDKIISLQTNFTKELSLDGMKYCKETLNNGIKALSSDPSLQRFIKKNGKLGIIMHSPCESKEYIDAKKYAESLIDEVAKKNENVSWERYLINEDKEIFYGPSFRQLGKMVLNHFGIYQERSLWICRVLENEGFEGINSFDAFIANQAVKDKENKIFALLLGKNDLPEDDSWKGKHKKDHFLKLKDKNGDISSLKFACPISLHPQSGLLRHLGGSSQLPKIFKKLQVNYNKSFQNVNTAKALFCEKICNTFTWYCNNKDRVCPIFNDCEVFDDQSGAICFSAYEWYEDVLTIKNSPWKKVVDFFKETLEIPWQNDRPIYRRILATPTRFLLRGEDYYSNLRNIFPLTRLKDLVEYTNQTCNIISTIKSLSFNNKTEWKLYLGLLDQLRNSALQFAWLDTNITSIYNFKGCKSSSLSSSVIKFLDDVILIYYSTFSNNQTAKNAVSFLEELNDCWTKLKKAINQTIKKVEKIVEGWRNDYKESHLKTTKLIRRWREADHPGENLLVAMQAIESLSSGERTTFPVGIGIGWGGIELPLIYRVAVRIIGDNGNSPYVYASHYSKYSKDGQKRIPHISKLSSLSKKDTKDNEKVIRKELKNQTVIVFDDNSLSGNTIQRVVEDLTIEWEAKVLSVFITRLSGERRYDQMRMEGHGVLNPDLIEGQGIKPAFIFGHLGETPFSRAWSRQEYENPIGIFSLSRRRILEHLHANSSANRFDREGF